MNDIVFLKRNTPFTDSKIISECTKNKHHAVQQLISRYASDFEDYGKLASEMRPSSRGQMEKVFLLNELQATLLMSYMKNSEEVRKFKKRLVSEFYHMKQLLLERQTQDWISTRAQGKLTRQAETAVIKKLVEYARDQGSTHADKLYMTYSKLAKKMADVENRDTATTQQLMDLSLMENVILHQIDLGILAGLHYKQIYHECKNRLSQVKQIAYIGG